MAVADATYNHLPILLGAHPIYWQLTCIDKVKELIISQTRIRASSKQVIATIQTGIDEENPLVKPKDVFNEYVAERQKQLDLFIPVQLLIVELDKQVNWYTYYVKEDEDYIEQLFFAKVLSQKILKYNY